MNKLIEEFKQKLLRQAELAKTKTDLAGFSSVKYSIVKIIKSDPIFFEFVEKLIHEE